MSGRASHLGRFGQCAHRGRVGRVLEQSGPPHLGPLRLPESDPVPSLIRRAMLAVALVVTVVIVLWIDRGGLRDHANSGAPLGISDVIYFTVVSLTTLGYGDISPVTTESRLLNAL